MWVLSKKERQRRKVFSNNPGYGGEEGLEILWKAEKAY
jgi:hypothetical protein